MAVILTVIVHIASVTATSAPSTGNPSAKPTKSLARNNSIAGLGVPRELCEKDFCGNIIYHVICRVVRDSYCTAVDFPDDFRIEKTRHSMLHAFNYARNEWASGYGLDIEGYFPGSSNMHRVVWSSQLEFFAHVACHRCLVNMGDDCRDTVQGSVGQLFFLKMYDGVRAPGDAEVFNDWYLDSAYLTKEVVNKYISAFDNLTSPAILFWKLREIGCSSATITLKSKRRGRLFICNLWPAGPIYGWPIYRAGNPCQDCALGFGCKSDGKYPLLCEKYLPSPDTIHSSGPKVLLSTILLFICIPTFS